MSSTVLETFAAAAEFQTEILPRRRVRELTNQWLETFGAFSTQRPAFHPDQVIDLFLGHSSLPFCHGQRAWHGIGTLTQCTDCWLLSPTVDGLGYRCQGIPANLNRAAGCTLIEKRDAHLVPMTLVLTDETMTWTVVICDDHRSPFLAHAPRLKCNQAVCSD